MLLSLEEAQDLRKRCFELIKVTPENDWLNIYKELDFVLGYYIALLKSVRLPESKASAQEG